MRPLIRSLDALLRRRQQIREFWDHPDCLFRIRLRSAPWPLPLAEGTIPAGAPVLELHFWNEHLPHLPSSGADVAWGARGGRLAVRSLQALARHIGEARELRSVTAVMGVIAFFSVGEAAGAERLVRRLGFATAPYRSPLGAFGAFWEDVYTRGLLWTFNRHALRRRRAPRLRRVVVWMSVRELLRRYAPANPV